VKVSKLTRPHQLVAYQAGFKAAIQARSGGARPGEVSVDYLRRCHAVRGVHDTSGRMVAGYAVCAGGPFRLLEFVPEDTRGTVRPPAGASWEDCCEVTVMWRERQVSRRFMAKAVWPRVVVDVLTSRKRFILGHNEDPGLDAYYRRYLAIESLYCGRSTYGLESRLFAVTRADAMRGAGKRLVAEARAILLR
jgi:hypothetical protein